MMGGIVLYSVLYSKAMKTRYVTYLNDGWHCFVNDGWHCFMMIQIMGGIFLIKSSAGDVA
ncbi:MAG: hypothetical protein ACJAW1_003494 [Glaciecola sp.]|jgi:hypothetical protein